MNSKLQSRHITVWLLFIAMLIIGFIALDYLTGIPSPGISLNGQLSEVQKNTIQILVELTKLLISWSMAIIGAMAYLIKSKTENKIKLSQVAKWSCLVSLAAGITSIYAGHLVLSSIVNSLSHNLFSIRDFSIAFPGMLQYFSLILSLSAACTFVVEELFISHSTAS